MACGGSSPVRSLSVGLHRNGSRVLHVQLLRSCRYSSLVFSVPSQLTRVYQKVTKKQAQDARSKNVKNPLKKMFRRKSSGKPSAKDLLEKALAERKKTVPVGERELVAPHATPTALKPTHHPKKSVDELLAEGNQRSSFLCRTKFFKDMVASAFELVDADGSGEVDEKELYSGLLLIHLKLGTYAGPAACRPISREQCHTVFLKMDTDQSGYLDREEFEAVMMVLFGNVMMRVAIQYSFTLLVVPMIAQILLDVIMQIVNHAYTIITTLDEKYELFNRIESSLEHILKSTIDFWKTLIPLPVTRGLGSVQELLELIPESVWNTIPLTLLSTVLCLVLVPWALFKIDEFFQGLADRPKMAKNKVT